MVASVRFHEFTFRTGSGLQDVTIPGAGTCKGYIIFHSNGQTNGTEVRSCAMSVAMAGTDGTSHAVSYTDTDNRATTELSSVEDAVLMRSLGPDTSGDINCNHDSFITDGFRFEVFANANRAEPAKAMIFYGDDINCIVGELTTSATDDAEVTASVAQQSDLLIVAGRNIASQAAIDAAHSFGVASKIGAAITQAGMSYQGEDGVPTSNVVNAVSSSRIGLLFDFAGSVAPTAWEVTTMSRVV